MKNKQISPNDIVWVYVRIWQFHVSETDPMRKKLISSSSEMKNVNPDVRDVVTVCSPSTSRCWTCLTADFLFGLLMFGSMCDSPKELG